MVKLGLHFHMELSLAGGRYNKTLFHDGVGTINISPDGLFVDYKCDMKLNFAV